MNKQQFVVHDTGIRGKALCVFKDNTALIYVKGEFQVISIENKELVSKFNLPVSKWKKISCKLRILERALHIEPRWAMPFENKVLILWDGKVYKVDPKTGIYGVEKIKLKGKPLNIACINDIKGFSNSLIIGDYYKNSKRDEVRLFWRRESNQEWEIAYTFTAGKIRHIHNIVPDKQNERVLILSGDEDNESGIWEAKDNFRVVRPLFIGKQLYRACQATIFNSLMYYATDTPSEENAIYCINNKERNIEKIADLRGSCIYGHVYGDLWCFSTTCEPKAHAKNVIDYWMSNTPGEGILDDKIDVCLLDKMGNFHKIGTFISDKLPLRLFQYATAFFACNTEKSTPILFTPVCVKKYDMHVFEIINILQEG